MSKLLDEILEDVVIEGEIPSRIFSRGKQMGVRAIMDRWYDTGCWWEGEAYKLFFRIQLEGEKVWEIYQDLSDGRWHLYKVYD